MKRAHYRVWDQAWNQFLGQVVNQTSIQVRIQFNNLVLYQVNNRVNQVNNRVLRHSEEMP